MVRQRVFTQPLDRISSGTLRGGSLSSSPFRIEVLVLAHEVDGVGREVAAVDGQRGALEPLEQWEHRVAGAAAHL